MAKAWFCVRVASCNRSLTFAILLLRGDRLCRPGPSRALLGGQPPLSSSGA